MTEVKKHKVLYDCLASEIGHPPTIEEAWMEVASVMNRPVIDLMDTFYALRRYHRHWIEKHIRNPGVVRKFRFAGYMQFLKASSIIWVNRMLYGIRPSVETIRSLQNKCMTFEETKIIEMENLPEDEEDEIDEEIEIAKRDDPPSPQPFTADFHTSPRYIHHSNVKRSNMIHPVAGSSKDDSSTSRTFTYSFNQSQEQKDNFRRSITSFLRSPLSPSRLEPIDEDSPTQSFSSPIIAPPSQFSDQQSTSQSSSQNLRLPLPLGSIINALNLHPILESIEPTIDDAANLSPTRPLHSAGTSDSFSLPSRSEIYQTPHGFTFRDLPCVEEEAEPLEFDLISRTVNYPFASSNEITTPELRCAYSYCSDLSSYDIREGSSAPSASRTESAPSVCRTEPSVSRETSVVSERKLSFDSSQSESHTQEESSTVKVNPTKSPSVKKSKSKSKNKRNKKHRKR